MKAHIEKEFIEACSMHTDSLFRYCFFKVSDREVAKDLVQDTFMKTWNYLTKGEEIDNIRAFFYRILNNLIIDEYRKKKSISLEILEESGFEPEFNEVEILENNIDATYALSLLDKIPQMYKDIIVLRYVEDLSIKEIALITNQPENTVSVKLHRGLKKAQEIFKSQNSTE